MNPDDLLSWNQGPHDTQAPHCQPRPSPDANRPACTDQFEPQILWYTMTYSKTLKTYHNHVPTRSDTSQHVPNRSKMLWHHITSITRIHIIQLKEPLQNQRRIWIRFLSRPTWSTTRISSSSGRPTYFDFKSCQVPSSGRVIFQSKTLHWKMLWKSLSRTYILLKKQCAVPQHQHA